MSQKTIPDATKANGTARRNIAGLKKTVRANAPKAEIAAQTSHGLTEGL